MEIKKEKDQEDWKTKEAILRYLLWYGKENKFRLARVFKIGTEEVIRVLEALENERKIEMEGSKAGPITKSRKRELASKKELERETKETGETEPPAGILTEEAEESETALAPGLTNPR